jgi:outer membrane protein assembly factor BamB
MELLAAGDPQQAGPYRLRARLGAGGMGQVFLGYSPAGRAVAVKLAGSADGMLHALRTGDGRKRWVFPAGLGSPTGLAVAGQVVYLGGGSGTVYAVRASDGHRLWATPVGVR